MKAILETFGIIFGTIIILFFVVFITMLAAWLNIWAINQCFIIFDYALIIPYTFKTWAISTILFAGRFK